MLDFVSVYRKLHARYQPSLNRSWRCRTVLRSGTRCRALSSSRDPPFVESQSLSFAGGGPKAVIHDKIESVSGFHVYRRSPPPDQPLRSLPRRLPPASHPPSGAPSLPFTCAAQASLLTQPSRRGRVIGSGGALRTSVDFGPFTGLGLGRSKRERDCRLRWSSELRGGRSRRLLLLLQRRRFPLPLPLPSAAAARRLPPTAALSAFPSTAATTTQEAGTFGRAAITPLSRRVDRGPVPEADRFRVRFCRGGTGLGRRGAGGVGGGDSGGGDGGRLGRLGRKGRKVLPAVVVCSCGAWSVESAT